MLTNRLATFNLLYYRAAFRKHDSFKFLNNINEATLKQPFEACYSSRELTKQDETQH
jgi:hypothetical protein